MKLLRVLKDVTPSGLSIHRRKTSCFVMSEKALTKGSAFPPTTPGKLRIYSMRFCPYAERTLLVLAAKNVPHEVVNINLIEKPEWLFEKNPLGKVPALELDEKILVESLIISDYLDEVYPEPRLNHTDPYKRARDRMLLEMCGKLIAVMTALMKKDPTNEAWDHVAEELPFWEKVLLKKKTGFFGGSASPGMVDYMVWPFFKRISPFAQVYSFKPLPSEDTPSLKKWVEKMREDPVIKKVDLPPQFYVQYLQERAQGSKTYWDVGL